MIKEIDICAHMLSDRRNLATAFRMLMVPVTCCIFFKDSIIVQRLVARLSVVLFLFLFNLANAWTGELDVLPGEIDGVKPSGMMRTYLLGQMEEPIQRWKEDYEKRLTAEEIAGYQRRMRELVLQAIGGLPERTPLNPQITGTVVRPGYRAEKIVFESQPKHYVTALLFLPDAERFKPPYPGVIVPCGHNILAKEYEVYQSMGALLALSGMVGLVIDPIDQGERGQYLGEGGWPEISSVSGHINAGIGSILLGQNAARFEIWDDMRAIDYLQSRDEVDPRRIGCAGCSGGGTQTSYMMALDERISAAAPSCYLTSMYRLLTTYGAQDSEQNIFGQLAFGLEHADWIMMRASTPVLICAATKDAFDIGGTWDTFRYAKRLYSRMGFAERLDIMENDVIHSYGPGHREGTARWMSRWLLGKDQVITEPKIELLTNEECRCTPKGQVMLLPGARSVYDLNEDRENKLAELRKVKWAAGDRAELLAEVRRLAGIRRLEELPKPRVELIGNVVRDGYNIEKLVIEHEEGIVLPALLFLPENPKPAAAVLYVHQQGKAFDAGPDGPIERLVRGGKMVLAVDLRGTGETQAALSGNLYNDEFREASIAYLLGRSYVGMRAEDVLVCARYTAERIGQGENKVELIAVGSVGIAALHAAVLEPKLFATVHLSQMLKSWATTIHGRLNTNQMANVIHRSLEHYDLPDLMEVLSERLTVERPVDAMGENIDKEIKK